MPKKSGISRPTTKKANYSEADILSAVKRVVEDDGAKIRTVALEFNIDRMTLTRYVKKFQNGELKSQFRYWGNRSVFTEEEEVALSEYLQTSCKMYFGLARKEVMKLAYEYGNKINRQMPINWNANCSAGKHWFQGFMRRHPVGVSESQLVISPKCVRPFPTAQPRKTNRTRLGKTRILTDTPVKNEICQQKRKKENDGHKVKKKTCNKKLEYMPTPAVNVKPALGSLAELESDPDGQKPKYVRQRKINTKKLEYNARPTSTISVKPALVHL